MKVNFDEVEDNLMKLKRDWRGDRTQEQKAEVREVVNAARVAACV